MSGGKLSVVVMAGGPSEEREVSLQSGRAVAGALRGLGHEVREMDPQRSGWELSTGVDVVFLALHGTYGEDGTLQSELDELGVVYTGSSAEGSRVAFDKRLTKERFQLEGIPTPRFAVVRDAGASWPMGWQPPVVLKPARQGSSVGLQFVRRVADWPEALEEALRHGSEVLLEEFIAGRELTAGILGGEVLPLVEVRPRDGAYDYHHKYTAGATEYLCPAPLEAGVSEGVGEVVLAAFRSVGARDYGRVDVMLGAGGEVRVLEVNTLPGMTETSLLPKAAAAGGLGYGELCQRMLDLAMGRAKERTTGVTDGA